MKTCPTCKKEVNDMARFCSGCGYRFPEKTDASQTTQEAVCPQCGNALKAGARFCGKCGAKIEAAQEAVCPQCGNTLKAGAKFCGKCGAKIEAAQAAQASPAGDVATSSPLGDAPAAVPQKDYSLIGSFLHWNILPGQIAVKIDENDIAAFGKHVKGVTIQDGIKALFFVDGKVVAELDAGSYPFKQFGAGDFRPASTESMKTDEASAKCPQCGADIKPNAMFCPKCGAKLNAASENARAAERAAQKKGFLGSLFGAIGGGIANIWNRMTGRESRERAENAGLTMRIPASVPPVSFVLIRSTDFPLVFTFKGANTANVRSDVGLQLLCKINDINAFYTNMLLDRKMVCFESLSQVLAPLFESEVNLALAGVSPEAVANNAALQEQVLARLQALMPGVYPFLSVSRVLKLTAAQEDLDNLRHLREERYVSEQELNEAMLRNEFLNRMQNVRNGHELEEMRNANAHRNEVQSIRNAQELTELNAANAQHNALADIQSAQGIADLRRSTSNELTQSQINAQFEADKEKIYEEMALTQDERAKFDLMLKAQRQLREAKSQEEVEAAMHTYEQSGLLRKQEMDNLRRQIAQDARLKELDDAQLLAVTTMGNEHALEQQKFEWEILMGTRKLEEEIKLRRMRDAYQDEIRDKEEAHSDARREADANFEDSRRRAQMDLGRDERNTTIELDHKEQESQLDILAKAQALRMEREAAEHKRDMEDAAAIHQFKVDEKKLEMQAEQARLDAQVNTTQIYAGMTADQIMAANPNISEHAARALEAKFNSDHAVEAANAKAQMTEDMKNQMTAFMQQMMQGKEQDKQAMQAMMMQLMQMNNQQNQTQMQMMRDMGVAQAGSANSFQQQLLDAKQQELDHTRADAAANSDRFVDGMKTTINAVGNMGPTQFIPVQPVAAQPRQGSKEMSAPQASAPTQTKSAACVCPQCGAPVESGTRFCDKCGNKLFE